MKTISIAFAVAAITVAPALAQQQPPAEHTLRLNDQDVRTIVEWGRKRPYEESADVLSKMFQQLTAEQVQGAAQAEQQRRQAIEQELRAKEKAAPEPAK